MSTASVRNETAFTLDQRRIWLIFSGLLLGMLLGALDQTIVATALPTIVSDLGGLNELSWVVTAYLLASTASTPLWGKLGDLYGRKRVYQAAILIFLAGSALAGLSRDMIELIAFRALQGLGGGGLIVTAQAVVGDIVPPRDRGRYQGIFGAVFGVASIAGPLLGGFFVDHLSWHWVFYVNIPIGALALLVTGIVLPAFRPTARPIIDYLGTALVAVAATSLVLLSTLGGITFAWLSAPILGLGVLALLLVLALVLVERRAAQPVLPLGLFRNSVFSMTSAISFIIGFAMFGAITYLPLYLQVVKGASPTDSGLQLLPMVGGMLAASIASGQLISRWGRYKVFPIAGTAAMTAGLFLLSRMNENSPTVANLLAMFVLGLGLGLVMQVLVIAVQNAVDYANLGAATSGVTFFRSIGGAFGVAVFGAIFANGLVANLARFLPASGLPAGFNPETAQSHPEMLRALSPAAHAAYLHAYSVSLQTVFIAAIPFGMLAFALTWLLREQPLRRTAHAAGEPEPAGSPAGGRSTHGEIERALNVLMSRDDRRLVYERIAARAGLPLDGAASWLLFTLGERGPATLEDISAGLHTQPVTLVPPLSKLSQAGMIAFEPDSGDGNVLWIVLTADGKGAFERLVQARREGLAQLLAGWPPEQHADLRSLLARLAYGRRREEDTGDWTTSSRPPAGA